ncbi:MAG: polymer-forming cytoskeletal protein [Bacteroidia bacterium]|jgi:cytoskeletal protein CcmA (bactofilin family)|nr:polymer-forming cytoskeletal protein [Bacteroidia bacterium]
MALFNNTKSAAVAFNPNTLNIINSGTQITGDVNSDGDMRVDGTIKGYLTSKARLVLGPTAIIDGDIKAANIEISGEVNGNIYASELLTIKASAKINGDIISNKLIIESGASFNGNCKMNKPKEASINNSSNAAKPAPKPAAKEAVAQ